MIALLEAHKAGLLSRSYWGASLISGLVVGVVALPLSMAFAIASGAKPEQGLYTAIVASICVSLFGGSRVQVAGPTGAFIVILSGITARYGVDGLQVATLMAGIILLLFGLAGLGSVIRYIPAPVILGFTAGIAVIIWVGQWKDFFGLPAVSGIHFHEKLWHLVQEFPRWDATTTGVALFSLVMVLITPKLPVLRRIPGQLVALVLGTLLQSLMHFSTVTTIGSVFGGIPEGLPHFHIPDLSFHRVLALIGPAFTIALLGSIESLLSAVVADGMAGTRHDSNQELIGQGLGNLLSPFFGGFAATGAIARTATNVRNGGVSPLSGQVHAATLILITLILAPLAANIPLATLAAILFVVSWNMSEARHFIRMIRRAPQADVAILLITFFLTVFADLVVAVNIGVILATLHFLRRMSSSMEVKQATDQELKHELSSGGMSRLPPGVQVYSVEGPFFFGAVENFERALANTHSDPCVLVIRLRWVPFMDITGLQTLEEVIGNFKKRGVRVMVTGANERVRKKLERAGIIELLGTENSFQTFEQALELCRDMAEHDPCMSRARSVMVRNV